MGIINPYYFAFIFPLLSMQSDVSTARKPIQTVQVDGQTNDWQKPFNFFDSSTRLFFGIVNDNDYLYLSFESPEPLNHLKIIKSGMIVSVSTKGKSKVNCSIQFPVAEKKKTKDIPNLETEFFTLKKEFAEIKKTMVATGFKTENGKLPTKSSKIEVDAEWNESNEFAVEYKIALKEIFGADFSIENFNEVITLKVNIPGFQAIYQPIQSQDMISSQRNVSGQRPGQNPGDPNSVMGNQNEQLQANEPEPTGTETVSPQILFLRQSGELKQKFLLNK